MWMIALRAPADRTTACASGFQLGPKPPAGPHNWIVSMGVVQACLQGEVSIRRARSLFADAEPTSAPAESAQLLTAGADTTAAAGRRTSGLSGAGIDAHHQFVNTSTPAITKAALNDLILGDLVDASAAITRAGASQLDAIAQQARATTLAAVTARTPAAQHAVLAAMRIHVRAADDVVAAARRQAADLAAGVKSIDYRQSPPGAGHDEFGLDMQYARPAGLPGGVAPLVNPTDWTPSTQSCVIAITMGGMGMWCQASKTCASKAC